MAKKFTREEVVKLRKIIEKAMAFLNDTEAIIATTFYPNWDALLAEGKTFTEEEVAAGYRVQHNDVLYKVLQTHTIQENWTPDVSPSLFAKVLIPDENVIPEWEQPDATNPYMTGDKVIYNGIIYESLVDNNVWEPGVIGNESLWIAIE